MEECKAWILIFFFFFFVCGCPIAPASFIEKIIFSPMSCFCSFFKDQLIVFLEVYFWGLYSVPLICWVCSCTNITLSEVLLFNSFFVFKKSLFSWLHRVLVAATRDPLLRPGNSRARGSVVATTRAELPCSMWDLGSPTRD